MPCRPAQGWEAGRPPHWPASFLALAALAGLLFSACTAPEPLPEAPRPTATLPTGSEGLPWWNDTVFYQVFVRSFLDSNADGVGDLPGLIDRLDYLNDGNPETSDDLGVTGLWLLPIHPSPSYHGYDVTDYFAVQPAYGSLDDFRQLLDEAHRRGIRVLIDLVLNHTSSQHPWFTAAQNPASPYRTWYRWSATDPGQPHWHASPSGYYYGFFGPHMPDLNYATPAVTQEMLRVARFWVEEVGVDGFRIDAAKYLWEEGQVTENAEATHQWFRDFTRAYREWDPAGLSVAEVWDSTGIAVRYAQPGQLDLTFEFSLAQAFIVSARTGRADEARRVLSAALAAYRPNQFATFLSNHDQSRVMSQLAGKPDKARVAAALLLTSPGVPFVYYGEEIGMTGTKPDERIRTPMQWSAEPNAGFTTAQPWEELQPDVVERNIAAQDGDPASLLHWYRDLIRLRSKHPALRLGSTLVAGSDSPSVFSLLRWSQDEMLLTALNLGPDSLTDSRLSLEGGPLQGSYTLTPIFGPAEEGRLTADSSGGFQVSPPGPLPGYSLSLWRLDPTSTP